MKRFLLSFVSAILAIFAISAQTAPTLYGVLKSGGGMQGLASGICSMTIPDNLPSDNFTLTQVAQLDLKYTKCVAWADNKLYGYKINGETTPNSVNYFVIDTDTWTVETTAYISGNAIDGPSSMYYNPTDKKLYGYQVALRTFYEIDPATGKMTKIKEISDQNLYFTSVAVNASGNVYAIDFSGNLWMVYPTEGTASKIGNTGLQSSNSLPSVFDLRSGDLYLNFIPSYGSKGSVYKLDTKNASATKIGDIANSAVMTGLFIKNEALAEDSQKPYSPSDITTSYTTPGGKEAVLSAVAPTLAFDQTTALTGNVDITFYVDDTPAGIATGVVPGTKASVNHTFTTDGLHYVKAVASNNFGQSPESINRTFVGFDTPKPVSDLNLSIDSDGKVTLNWSAPTCGINNGDLDASTLAYSIIRMPEGISVADGLKVTTFSETLTDNYLRDYCYSVTATSSAGNSEVVLSNHVASGEAVRLPFVDDFQNDNQWNLFTVIDENNDGEKWTYNADQKRVQLQGNKNAATDWLVLPAVNMREDVAYTLKFTANMAFNQTGNLNVYVLDTPEVPWGGTDALERLGYAQLSDQLTQNNFTYESTANGKKYFAIYNYSNPGVRVEIHSISVTASSAPDAPGKVTDMMVVAGEKGAINATILFKAPTKLENGEALTADNFTAIEIYAGDNDKAIKRIGNPKPGQAYSYKDESAFHGMNFYRVICYNDNGNGTSVSASAWIGEDYATAPKNFKASYDPSEEIVNLKWDAPDATGYSGGYVDLDNITYSLAVFIIGGSTDDYITFASGLKERTGSINVANLRQFFAEGDRQGISFKVTPVTAAGPGVPAISTVIIGDAYTLPFAESFANARTSSKPWSVISVGSSQIGWAMRSSAPEKASLAGLEPQDADGGMAIFFPTARTTSRLVGPKITIEDAEDPTVTFYLYHRSANAQNWLEFGAIDDDGVYHALSDKILIDGFGWEKHEIHINDFNTDKLGEFRFAFTGAADAGVDFYLDNINFSDGKAVNPYPTVKNLKADSDGTNVTLTWDAPENTGYSLIGYYVYRDGQKVSNRYLTETTYTEPLVNDGASHSYAVQVVYNEGDSDLCDAVTVDPAGVESVGFDNISVSVVDSKIVLQGNSPYIVYNLAGAPVAKGVCNGSTVIELPSGVYFVKTSAKSAKVII